MSGNTLALGVFSLFLLMGVILSKDYIYMPEEIFYVAIVVAFSLVLAFVWQACKRF